MGKAKRTLSRTVKKLEGAKGKERMMMAFDEEALAVFGTWGGLLMVTEPFITFTLLSAYVGPKFAFTVGILRL